MNDLERLVADLSDATDFVQQQARRVVANAGDRVRDEARALAPRRGLPHYAATITSEVVSERMSGTIAAEIGPERGGQGSLGAILEYGTSRTPPQAHLAPALDREAPRLEHDLADLLDPFRRPS